RPQMNETQFLIIPAASDPAVHSAAVTVDTVPHHFAHKAPDRFEARHPVEFCHTKRHVVAMPFFDQPATVLDISLAATGRDARINRHPLHEDFEVPWWQAQIEI